MISSSALKSVVTIGAEHGARVYDANLCIFPINGHLSLGQRHFLCHHIGSSKELSRLHRLTMSIFFTIQDDTSVDTSTHNLYSIYEGIHIGVLDDLHHGTMVVPSPVAHTNLIFVGYDTGKVG